MNKSRFIDSGVLTIKQIHKFIKKHKSDIFFTKQKCWEGENEYRIISNQDEYLDISNAITAVYLTSCDSTECLLTEQLVGDNVPVRFLHYIEGVGNKALPMISDTNECRIQKESAKTNPKNVMVDWSKKAMDFYEQHKTDEDFDLSMHIF